LAELAGLAGLAELVRFSWMRAAPEEHGVNAQLLGPRDRAAAVRHLACDPRGNLLLLDLAHALGRVRRSSEASVELVAAWCGSEVVGMVALRPSLMLDALMDEEALDVLLPYVGTVEAGLVKSGHKIVGALWRRLERAGRTALVDRAETAYWLRPGDALPGKGATAATLRPAEPSDLESLVQAARASLREEGRPDPFDGDPTGFRRWVRGRLHRARVVEADGRLAFVGYADVRRREGWLIQGVYTWPDARRRGYARLGMAGIIAEAFAASAEHVQLAVVDGNDAAEGLYRSLGFSPFEKLRTVLFV